ncbi:MAG: endolytic transglycosylase MltG, partial [Alicyclobacillus sp.]|nr:endolytic transglycosylase MltG [Alicyclobacillus sp.]
MSGECKEGAGSALGRRRVWLRWAGAVLGAAVFLTAAAVGAAAWALSPLPGTGSVQVTLPRGDSVRAVAQTLQAHGLVRSAWAFQLYAVVTGRAGRVQAGTYNVPRGLSAPDLLALLVSGKALDRSASVTIPEGYTVEQIADRLAAAGICSRQAFLDEVQHGVFTEPIVQQLPSDAKVKYRLEGFLFPDTYRFAPDTPAHAVIDEMLQAFEHNVDQPYGAVAKAEGRTLYDVVTEASLIEREAR